MEPLTDEELAEERAELAELTELDTRFHYHPPKDGQPELYARIRDKAHDFARFISEFAPYSREREVSLTKLDEVVMWANAAIARRG